MWEETDDPPGDRQKVALWLGRGYDMMRAEEEEPEGAAGDGGERGEKKRSYNLISIFTFAKYKYTTDILKIFLTA